GFDNGVHTFVGGATLRTATLNGQTWAITVTEPAVLVGGNPLTGSQTGLEVDSAATSKLILSGYPSPVTAGTGNNFTVTASDPFGNVTPTFAGSVPFSSSDGQAVLPTPYTFNATDAA